MRYDVKSNIVDKISKLIALYAKNQGLIPYLILKKYNDKERRIYPGYKIDTMKLFSRIATFSNKKLFDNRGKRTSAFYTEHKRWLASNLTLYYNTIDILYRLLNFNSTFTVDDLNKLNQYYRMVKK